MAVTNSTAMLSNNNLHFKADVDTVDTSLTQLVATVAGLTLSSAAGYVEMFGVAAPSTDNSAVNKSYVDAAVNGLDWLPAVRVASTENLTLASILSTLVVDGVTLADGDRILLKNQTIPAQNGVYIVPMAVDPNDSRSLDMPLAGDAKSKTVFVEEGTVNKDQGYLCTNDAATDTIGTHDLVFTQISGTGQISAGNAIIKTGNVLDVAVDGTTIVHTGDELSVPDSGIVTAKIADAAVTTVKIADDAVITAKILDANVTTAKIADDAVITAKILDANVTTAKIADANITTAKIANANITTAKIADANVTTAKVNFGTNNTDPTLDTTAIFADDVPISLHSWTQITAPTNTMHALELLDSGLASAVAGNLVLSNGEATMASESTLNVQVDNVGLQITGTVGVDSAISIKDAGVVTTKLATDAVTTIKITDANVTSAKIAADAITTVKILDANVTNAKLATNAVTTAKITDHNVTTAKIANANVTTAKIADDAITTLKILDANVTTAKIADDAVTTPKILDANVTTAKIADANITTAKIADDNVTTAKIADANVTTLKILDANVTAAKLAANSVTTIKILDANVTTAKIADANVTAAKLATDAVTTIKILDANVTEAKLATNAVTSTKIAADAVTTTKILDANVTSAKLADGAVTNAKLVDDDLTITVSDGVAGGGLVALGGTVALTVDATVLRTSATAQTKTGALTISNATASTTSSTGALIVTGGLGVGTASYFGNSITSTNFISTSDQRLKTNVEDVTDATAKISQLRPVYFNWIDKEIDEVRHCGVLAQEVEEVDTDCVRTDPNDKKSVDYQHLFMLLLKSHQELRAEFDALKEKLA